MNQADPMPREQLHGIAVRRRNDPDVRTLLLEIKRLRGVMVQAYGCCCRISRYTEDTDHAAALGRFLDVLEAEPAVCELEQPSKPRPTGPTERELKKLAHRMRN